MNDNIHPPKFLIFFATTYIVIVITSLLFAYKTISIFGWYTSAGVFVLPIAFVLADVIAEMYGLKISRQILYVGITAEFLFGGIAYFLLSLKPSPTWLLEHDYNIVFDPIIRTTFASIVAFFLGGLINVYCISKWRILLKGKYFWLRSIGSSAIGELVFTLVCVSIIFINHISYHNIIEIMVSVYLIKLIFNIILAAPANFIKNILKHMERNCFIQTFSFEEVITLGQKNK